MVVIVVRKLVEVEVVMDIDACVILNDDWRSVVSVLRIVDCTVSVFTVVFASYHVG